jgi:hypothetical protein
VSLTVSIVDPWLEEPEQQDDQDDDDEQSDDAHTFDSLLGGRVARTSWPGEIATSCGAVHLTGASIRLTP